MLMGIAELVLVGLIFDWLFRKMKFPGLIGLLFLGILVGPYVFNLLNNEIQMVSHELRLLALIVILLRAGFEMSRESLEKVGARAVLMSFIPCICEIATVTFTAPLVLPVTRLEAAMLGSILAAVSPAVVVPLMIQLIEEGRGAQKGIPTLVLAGASVDDAVAIVLCSSFVALYTGESVKLLSSLMTIPLAILAGIAAGLLFGLALYHVFKKFNPRATKRVLIILGIAILLLKLQSHIELVIPFSALISLMAIGFIILEKDEHVAHEISSKLGKIWVFAQLLLFTLVGAKVNIPVAVNAGLGGMLVIFTGLLGRSCGVQICLIRSGLTVREKIFVVFAYLPKATVQAAIGGVPLAAMLAKGMNTQPGELILAVAVLSILITAPIGAYLISWSGRRFLTISARSADESPAMRAALESE